MLMRATPPESFSPINPGYNSVFRPERLSVGLVVPIESYPGGPVPTMEQHLQRVQLAEDLGSHPTGRAHPHHSQGPLWTSQFWCPIP